MFPEPYDLDLRSNGPITHYPSWEAALAACKARSPRQGESPVATSPLPQGESVEAPAALNPLNPEPQPLNSSRRGRPKTLDRDKQATICNLVAAGVSLRQAAQFVDCHRGSIRREAQRNGAFRRQLAKARSEASIHPLQTLRQAAKADWRAALCWMERLDPERFARPDASIITKREANQFVGDLVESIERAVRNSEDRADLYELLSAAMPAAMRRRWDGHGSRRTLNQAMREFDKKRNEAVGRRAKRRREFTARIASYLPWQLIRELGDYNDVLDPDVIQADCAHEAARQNRASDQPQDDAPADSGPLDAGSAADDPLDDGPLDDRPTNSGRAPGSLPNPGSTNFAPPEMNFAPPPGRNSNNIAPPSLTKE